jgi:hypothetical protein
MEVKLTTQKGGIPLNRDNPEKAAIFFYTQFDDLSFLVKLWNCRDIKGDPGRRKVYSYTRACQADDRSPAERFLRLR